MNSQKIKPINIVLDGKNYEMRVDFNCFAELEEIYGDIDTVFKRLEKPSLKDLRNCIYATITHQDESLTPLKVGQMIKRLGEISDINKKVMAALNYAISAPNTDEKNAASQEQTE